MSGTPEWLDDKGKIIEHRYCRCFLEKQPLLSKGEDFFTTEGIVTDKDRLLRDVFDDIKEHLTGGLVTKAKNLLEAIRMECYDRGELEKYQDRIFLANGTLFLDGRFVEEKSFCLNRLPIFYNPNEPRPEAWLRFLSELLEPEDILTLQEFMGYCLIPCTRGQVMLLIKGNGGEGKSRIGVVMHTLFGANAKNGSIDKVETSAFARADLQHVLVMVDDDTKMEALSSTHYVKSIITAETPMDLERKKEQSFQGDMYVRIMAFSNGDLEALYDKSEGFFRRQLILQTRRKPPGRVDDPFLSDKLKQEAEGIFLWCLDGLKRLQSNNYRFTVSQRAAENKEHAKRNANNLVEFMQSEGYIQLKADSTITSRELYAIYQMWCEDNAIKCMNNGGNTPLGYYVDKATGKLEIDPETAPYVRELFSRYADGERLTVLEAEMEQRGLRSKRGNPYSISVLSNLLKNRKYIGQYKYGDVIIPDGIPAIIDKELFERVQTRMAANKKAPERAKAEEEYLLTTKLYCGECGRLMAGESGKGCKGVVYHYYKCSGAKRKLGCKKKAIRKDWIEDVVVKFTVTHVLTDTAIDRIADAIVVMQEQEDTMTPVLKQQLQQCETEIRNVMKAIRQGIITDTTKECLEELEEQRDSLKASIAQLALERRKFTKEEIVEWISRYKGGNINDPDYRREIIDTFVNSVYVYDDKLLLTYNYRDGTQALTLKEIEAALSSDLTSMCPPDEVATSARVWLLHLAWY